MTQPTKTTPYLSRRALLGTASFGIGAVAGAAARSRSAHAANLGSVLTSEVRLTQSNEGTPSVDALLQTPPGKQLGWLLAAINEGAASLTEAEVSEHFAAAFLAAVPPAQLIGLVQSLAAGYGTLTLQGVTRPITANQVVALVLSAVGLQLSLPISVEADAPHLITGTTIYPSPSGDGEPVLPAVGEGVATAASSPLFDIGDRQLYCAAVGSGKPTVIFEAGLGDSGATWSGIIPAVAAFTRVISYDRPNTIASASDSAPMPRTPNDVVTDLHALLELAADTGPHVLVGHSVGGIFTRLFASQYPDRVAGLVLVDASHEDQEARRKAIVSDELFAAEQMAVGANSEGVDLATSFAQMKEARAAAPLRPMPLIVLSAGQGDPATFPVSWPMEDEAILHAELQADLAGLVPGGRLVVAEQSGHYIQQRQPDLVVEAIRAVVNAVHDPSTWATPAATG